MDPAPARPHAHAEPANCELPAASGNRVVDVPYASAGKSRAMRSAWLKAI